MASNSRRNDEDTFTMVALRHASLSVCCQNEGTAVTEKVTAMPC